MTRNEAQALACAAMENVRTLAEHYGCRVEISSDVTGALGRLCCTASNEDRSRQGFGSTIEAAVEHFRHVKAKE